MVGLKAMGRENPRRSHPLRASRCAGAFPGLLITRVISGKTLKCPRFWKWALTAVVHLGYESFMKALTNISGLQMIYVGCELQ